MFLGLAFAAGVIVADQLSKYLVLLLLGDRAVVPLTGFFDIVRAWNPGVSFSMLNSYGNVGAVILSVMALVIVFVLFQWLKKEPNRLIQAALGLIIGGALGNVIDRVRFGAVFDFLDFYIGESHWPAFNVADSCICVGAAIIIFQAVLQKKTKRG